MDSSSKSQSPLEAASNDVGRHAIETFKLLGDETRLAILLALWDAYDPRATENGITFSDLRHRVGVQDSGQFNYHLGKLEGQFIQKTEAGYELLRPGRKLIQSIIAGTGIQAPILPPTEIDDTCDLCGAPVTVSYENAYVYLCCTECLGQGSLDDPHPTGVLSGWTMEPTGLEGRTAAEVYTTSTIKTLGRIAMRMEGICPDCSGPVEWDISVCQDHDSSPEEKCAACGREEEIFAQEICTVCKSSGYGNPSIKILLHPAVVAFYYDHGIELGFTGTTELTDILRMMAIQEQAEEEVHQIDPLRIQVTLQEDDEELVVVLDEMMTVLETHRQPVSSS